MVFLMVSAPAAAAEVKPGKWQTVMSIDSFSMPGMPAEALAAMKKQPPTTVTSCLTPQEAEADPKKLLAADKSCTLNRFNMAGGKMLAEMSCKTEQGPADIRIEGNYTPTSYQFVSSMKGAQMRMATRVNAKWLGPCK
jgi:hypothetical protein